MAVYQNLTLTELSQDVLANTSRVRILWQSQQTGQSWNGYTNTAYYYVSINGGAEKEYSVSYTLPQYTNKTIVDTILEVPHDDLGNGSISVRTWMDTRISAGVVRLSKDLQLAQIARASTLVASDAFIGATAAIVVDQKSKSYTHSIEYRFGEMSGYIANAVGDTSDAEVRLTATSIGFPVPEAFYNHIPDAPFGVCTLVCRTYSGDVLIGEPKTATFTVTAREAACRPLVAGAVTDCNPLTVALTGDDSVLINGFSTARCEITAEARNSAWLDSMTVNGRLMEDVLEIPNVETGSFDFVATDSRGFAGVDHKDLTLIPYFPLSGVLSGQRNGPTSYEANISIKGTWFNDSFGAVENALKVTYRVGNGDEVEIVPVIEENSYTATAEIAELDYTKNYTIEVVVADRVGRLVQSIMIKKGVPVFNWGEDNFTFNVPVLFQGGIGNMGLQNHPPLSLFLTLDETSPEVWFGGKWERLEGVFLLAASKDYPAGSTGGEAVHVLTAEELPAHAHGFLDYWSTQPAEGAENKAVAVNGDGTGLGDAANDRSMTAETGAGEPHNNMPPYIAVYIWVRVA